VGWLEIVAAEALRQVNSAKSEIIAAAEKRLNIEDPGIL
jgi:hypothetical protein